jgi:hypothetical protein
VVHIELVYQGGEILGMEYEIWSIVVGVEIKSEDQCSPNFDERSQIFDISQSVLPSL